MELGSNYSYAGEYREGFFVEEKMKRAWAAEMEVLKEIDRICNAHGIQYFADSGTLLGAVRHKGFIPWDDDIDIAMKREDYQKFLEVAPKELPEGWRLCNPFCDEEWDEPFSRVLNGNTYSLKFERMNRFHGCPYVVGIDIFPLDYVPYNIEEEEVQFLLLKYIFGVLCQIEKGDQSDEVEKNLEEIERLCKVNIERNKNLKNQLYRVCDKICRLYSESESNELAVLVWDMQLGEKHKCKKEWYTEVLDMTFENITVPAPAGFDGILRSYYGNDYMIPKQIRGGHDYPFYKKQEKELAEKINRESVSGND